MVTADEVDVLDSSEDEVSSDEEPSSALDPIATARIEELVGVTRRRLRGWFFSL